VNFLYILDAIAGAATIDVPALSSMEVGNALIVLVRRRKLADVGAWRAWSAARPADSDRP
jgi:hypothetical protein